MKTLIVTLLMSLSFSAYGQKQNFSWLDKKEPFRAEVVSVDSVNKIKIKDDKGIVHSVSLVAVNTKGLTPAQLKIAKEYIKSETRNKFLIVKKINSQYEVKVGGVRDLTAQMLEWGIVKNSDKENSYQSFEDLGKKRKVGIWKK